MADAIAALEQAVKEQDRPRIAKIAQQLSVGTAASILSELASKGLLVFLGFG